MIGLILAELKRHSPFTFFGALSGIVVAVVFHEITFTAARTVFYVLHPVHVFLSALVTAAMYRINKGYGYSLWLLLAIGYSGSVGIATLSDSVIPFVGEALLDMPKRGIHIGFIEKWWLVNPLAIAGVAIAYYMPRTKFPHAGHVLLSTWASTFHILMAGCREMNVLSFIVILFFLFVAVWIPCCVSDIVFPLLFVKTDTKANSIFK